LIGRKADVPQDPLDEARVVDQRDQPQAAATARTLEDVGLDSR
jgi:hypothetical protein